MASLKERIRERMDEKRHAEGLRAAALVRQGEDFRTLCGPLVSALQAMVARNAQSACFQAAMGSAPVVEAFILHPALGQISVRGRDLQFDFTCEPHDLSDMVLIRTQTDGDGVHPETSYTPDTDSDTDLADMVERQVAEIAVRELDPDTVHGDLTVFGRRVAADLLGQQATQERLDAADRRDHAAFTAGHAGLERAITAMAADLPDIVVARDANGQPAFGYSVYGADEGTISVRGGSATLCFEDDSGALFLTIDKDRSWFEERGASPEEVVSVTRAPIGGMDDIPAAVQSAGELVVDYLAELQVADLFDPDAGEAVLPKGMLGRARERVGSLFGMR